MTQTSLQQQALRNIRLQGWINFLAGAAFLAPVITLLYQKTNLGLPQIILLSNISTLCIWIFELPTSLLADTYGGKRSLLASVTCNLLALLCTAVFSFSGYVLAAFFAALYASFWSGTGQAFLDDNLRHLGKEDEFGKHIGHFMFLEQLSGVLTPLLAGALLAWYPQWGYQILLALDLVIALVLIFLTAQLYEQREVHVPLSFKEAFQKQKENMVYAIRTIWSNTQLRTILFFRMLGNHVAYFPIILLPLLTQKGMEESFSGIVLFCASCISLLTAKFAYKVAEYFSWERTWLLAVMYQAVVLIIIALFGVTWWAIALGYVFFVMGDSLWQPAWNHALVRETRGKAVATTRSAIFSLFALYTTMGKQVLAYFTYPVAFSLVALVMLVGALLFGLRLEKPEQKILDSSK